jgi:hypothetical protein
MKCSPASSPATSPVRLDSRSGKQMFKIPLPLQSSFLTNKFGKTSTLATVAADATMKLVKVGSSVSFETLSQLDDEMSDEECANTVKESKSHCVTFSNQNHLNRVAPLKMPSFGFFIIMTDRAE